MSCDGLLFFFFLKIYEKYWILVYSNLLFMVIVGGLVVFVLVCVVGEMISIGILFVFILVCVVVLIVCKSMFDVYCVFKIFFVFMVLILGIFICFCMMLFFLVDIWI